MLQHLLELVVVLRDPKLSWRGAARAGKRASQHAQAQEHDQTHDSDLALADCRRLCIQIGQALGMSLKEIRRPAEEKSKQDRHGVEVKPKRK